MQITVTKADDVTRVGIEGDLRIASVSDAKVQLAAILATSGEVRLDLSGLGECDTAGIQLLLMTCLSARAKGRRMVTLGHTLEFRMALDRIGIQPEPFDLQTSAPASTPADHDRR